MFEGQGHQRKLLLNLVGATSSGGFKVSLSVIYRNVMQCVMLPLRPFHIMHMLHCVSVYDTNGNDFSQLVMIIRNVARLGWYHLWDACQQNRVRIVRRISFLYNNFSEDHRPATLVYSWSTVSFCVLFGNIFSTIRSMMTITCTLTDAFWRFVVFPVVRWYTVNHVSRTNLMLVAVDASCQCDRDRILDERTAEVVHILYTFYTSPCFRIS